MSGYARVSSVDDPGGQNDVPRNPIDDAGFFSKLIFSWATPLLRLGYSRPLVGKYTQLTVTVS